MLGFETVTENNGWEYALVGIIIVFSGLVILSLVISQLHKLLDAWDNRASLLKALKPRRKKVAPPENESESAIQPSGNLEDAKRVYKMLVDRIGEPFSLPKLLSLAQKSGLYRPHATINDLLQEEIIFPDGTGYYVWKS